MGGQGHYPASLPSGMSPVTHCRGWLTPRAVLEARKPLAPTGFILRTLQPIANLCTDYAIPVHLLMTHHHLYCYFRCVLENNFLHADFLNMAFFGGHDCKIFYYRYFTIDLQNKRPVSLQYHSTNAPYSLVYLQPML